MPNHGHWSSSTRALLSAIAPVLALHLFLAVAEAMAPPMGLPGCTTTCGNVSVPYPFGISAGCFLPGFNLTCDRTHSPPRLLYDDGAKGYHITGIYLDNATMRVISGAMFNESFRSSNLRVNPTTWDLLGDGNMPFALSYGHNRFIFMGCGTATLLHNGEHFVADCSTSCYEDDPDHWQPNIRGACVDCNGKGCCQAPIPQYFPSYDVQLKNDTRRSVILTSIVLVAEKGWIEGVGCQTLGWMSPFFPIQWPPEMLMTAPVMLEWAMNSTRPAEPGIAPDSISKCPEDPASSACKSNYSSCIDMNTPFSSGYACRCLPGYYGNPYLIDGCQDIDECQDPDHFHCYGECTNLPGTYYCRCPHGYHGNSSVIHGCAKSSTGLSVGLGIGSGAAFLIVIFGTLFLVRIVKAQRKKKLREKFFKQNHGQLLQQLVGHMVDIGERMIVTLDEVEKATNNFDKSRELGGGGHGMVYKGILSSQHVVAIKKSRIVIQKEINEFINEVAILSQVNHRNIVKLLGCCLEAEVPLLIYEFVSNGTLFNHLHIEAPISLSWKHRLRIAVETARAITYLHFLASMPIIHRDIKSPNILLDDNLTVRLSDFGASRYIPIDQEGILTTVQGTLGYLDPMYHSTGHLTDKSDVYSFGVLLIELLTRKKPGSYRSSEGFVLVNHFVSLLSQCNLGEILDPQVAIEGDGEVVDVALLAAMCVKSRGEERPTMRQIEMTLESIQASKEFYSDMTDDDISS